MTHIVAAGDNVVDCYQSLDSMYPGGNCVNVAVFGHRFGVGTSYLGAVGDDPAGRLISRALETEGVDRSLLRVIPSGQTAWCHIGHLNGDRVFLGSERGVSEFSPRADDLTAIADADAVHIGASSYIDDWVEEFSARTKLSYDFSTYWDAERIDAVVPHTFLATLSGGGLSESEAFDLGTLAVRAGGTWVLVTRGSAGASLFHDDRHWTVSATPTEVIDTLGSGDTFLARVLVGLLRGEHPPELLAAASEAAAVTCRTISAFGYPMPIDDTFNLNQGV